MTPDFIYVLPNPATFTPDDGEYTVQNIMNNAFSNNLGAWWRIADHTVGNETGRMMVVNCFNPGSIFFRDTVLVQPNTNYLFTSWILNLFKVTGFANPALGVRILDEDNNILYSATLGAEIPVNINAPEWKEIGTVINSQDNTTLTVEFVNEGPAAIGNDYAIDDISLREVQVPLFVPVKTVSTPVANVGEVVTFTVTLENTCTSPLTNVSFQDTVPNGLEFLPGTVTINGAPTLGVDPNAGFTIPDIPGGTTATVTFDALVNSVPTPNPTLNTASMTYSYTPVEGGIPAINTVDSNTVPLQVLASADVSVIKTATPAPAVAGEILTYTIVVSNAGPSDAENVVLTDNIPPIITAPEFSIDGGITFNPWIGSFNIGTLPNGSLTTILIRGIVSQSATGTISNTATVTSTTPDPDPNNNTSTVNTEVNESADVSVVKTASPSPVTPGDMLTYTIVVSNAGPSDAANVVVNDAIPPIIIGPEFSIDGGVTFNPWTGSFNIGTLPSGSSRTILIRGLVNQSAIGTISNTATVTSTTPDPNPNNNTSTVNTEVNASADVSVIKTSSPNPVIAGEMINYTIVVSNAGPSDAANVILTDNIPPSITAPEFSIDGGVTFTPWTGSFNIGTLPSGSSRTILIRGIVRSSATGVISNKATVTSTTPDPNPNNNTSTVNTEVNTSADLSVKKKGSICSNIVTYKITVLNSGPSDARNVVLKDNIPDNVLGLKFSIDNCITFQPWRGCINIGRLVAGTSITIIIKGKVKSSCKIKIINTARVCSQTFDPNLTNNTSTVMLIFNGFNGCERFGCNECSTNNCNCRFF